MTPVTAQNPDALPDIGRRKLLIAATGIVGGAGVAAASIPFVVSMTPSERARAGGAPVEVFAKLGPGEQLTVEWRGKPVWILRRTEAMLKALENPGHLVKLADPDSKVRSQQPACCRNAMRSIKPEYFVAIGICTHLGCVPSYVPQAGAAGLGADWLGGFYCPCHGSKFDLAGRVYKNVPAPSNLVIPPHQYVTDTRLLIGEDIG